MYKTEIAPGNESGLWGRPIIAYSESVVAAVLVSKLAKDERK